MKRAILSACLVLLLTLLAACSGDNGNGVDPTITPLTIQLVWAEPGNGSSPLRVVFTANITGGEAPYYYSWDFTSDGSFDAYLNNEFRRTVSVTHDYYLKASDAGGLTQYQAMLTVNDSTGAEIASTPIDINVLGTSGLTIDPPLSQPTSDEIDDDGNYVFSSGNPVYFRVQPVGGTAPYRYQWDFDGDGAVDSTVANPQYTFNYNGVGVKMFVVLTTVIDANDEQVMWETFVEVVNPEASGPPPPPPFDVELNSTPPADGDDVIQINFDPTGVKESVPLEPELDLAIVVNPGTPGGSPPYEYYWDFENDGAIDSQELSPTIPYYDSARKILINPYMHQEDEKSFELRCMVIDSNGFVQDVMRTIIANNVAAQDVPLTVDCDYSVAGVNEPFAIADNRSSITNAQFIFDVTGAPGTTYQYQFDANGDGTPEEYDGDGDSLPDTVDNGWYVSGAASITAPVIITINVAYQGVGYFPANMTVRAINSEDTVVSMKTIEVPVSLVKLSQYSMDSGTLAVRTDHGIVANWTALPENQPANGQWLASREIIVAGGSVGTTSLNTVQRVIQVYTEPLSAGNIETLVSTEASDRAGLNQERSGVAMWISGPETGPAANIRIHGGWNALNGYLASNELSTGGAGNVPWTVLNENGVTGYYPLQDMGGTFVPGIGYMLGGGMHRSNAVATEVVSSRLISYDPTFDVYGTASNMQFARYDCGVAYVGGKVYVIGGRVSSGQAVATVEAYDPNTGMWDTFSPALNEPRAGCACEVVGGQIYVVGGGYWPNDESAVTMSTTAEVFNPATGVWSYTVPLPVGAEVVDIASTIAPSPGGVESGGAFANSMLCMGGRTTAGNEVNTLHEFTYFHVVDLPEAAE